jgi:hypothetical protein
MNNVKETIEDQIQKFFPQVKRILNKQAHIITKFDIANEIQDRTEGFDAELNAGGSKIAIRIRNNEFLKYHDITIRTKVVSGNLTEIDKIRKGCGDFYLYAWLTKSGKGIHSYVIFDIKKFVSTGMIDKPSTKDISNNDGSYFNTYSMIDMMKAGVIKIFENL